MCKSSGALRPLVVPSLAASAMWMLMKYSLRRHALQVLVAFLASTMLVKELNGARHNHNVSIRLDANA